MCVCAAGYYYQDKLRLNSINSAQLATAHLPGLPALAFPFIRLCIIRLNDTVIVPRLHKAFDYI